MLVAAYLVGGFLVASVYAVGMLRGRRDRYHYLASSCFTVGAIATPIQLGIGDGLARWVYQNQPVKFAALELLPNTETTPPRLCWVISTTTTPSAAASYPWPGRLAL